MLIPLPLLSIRTVNTVTDSNDTSAMLPQCLLVKDRQRYGRRFQVSKIFLRFFFCHVHPFLCLYLCNEQLISVRLCNFRKYLFKINS